MSVSKKCAWAKHFLKKSAWLKPFLNKKNHFIWNVYQFQNNQFCNKLLFYHCTYTALLEKNNVRGVPLIELFLPSYWSVLFKKSTYEVHRLMNVLFWIVILNRSISGVPRMLAFSNRAVYVQCLHVCRF